MSVIIPQHLYMRNIIFFYYESSKFSLLLVVKTLQLPRHVSILLFRSNVIQYSENSTTITQLI